MGIETVTLGSASPSVLVTSPAKVAERTGLGSCEAWVSWAESDVADAQVIRNEYTMTVERLRMRTPLQGNVGSPQDRVRAGRVA